MEMRSGPKVSGRSRRVAADQGWSLRGVPLYLFMCTKFDILNHDGFLISGGCRSVPEFSVFFGDYCNLRALKH